jgi:hypothetical protein
MLKSLGKSYYSCTYIDAKAQRRGRLEEEESTTGRERGEKERGLRGRRKYPRRQHR